MASDTATPMAIFFAVFVAFVIVIGTFAILTSFYTIGAGERGVLLTFGKPSPDAIGEGLHFKFPFAQSVKKVEVRTQKIETPADSASKDLQDVQTTIALNYHLLPGSVPQLYQEVGFDYQERVIDPIIQESIKSVSAQYTAEQLITKRSEVRQKMQSAIADKLTKYYIVVDDLNIVNFQFSEAFDAAIESKVTAEQLKFKAEMDLERIIVEKEQTIAQAQAEAESLRLQKQEITPDLIKLRQIEVQRLAIEKWNGVLPIVTGDTVPLIDIKDIQSSPAAPTV